MAHLITLFKTVFLLFSKSKSIKLLINNSTYKILRINKKDKKKKKKKKTKYAK